MMRSQFGINSTPAHCQRTKWPLGLAILMHHFLSIDVSCEYSPTGHKHYKPLTMSSSNLSSLVMGSCHGYHFRNNFGDFMDCLCGSIDPLVDWMYWILHHPNMESPNGYFALAFPSRWIPWNHNRINLPHQFLSSLQSIQEIISSPRHFESVLVIIKHCVYFSFRMRMVLVILLRRNVLPMRF